MHETKPVENIESILPGLKVGLINEVLVRTGFGLPEVGKIKIGKREIVNQRRLPRKLDHFIITTTERGPDGEFIEDRELMETVAARTGQSPDRLTRIPIQLPFDTLELNFQSWFSSYLGEDSWCRGDGQQAKRTSPKGTEIVPCPCERLRPEFSERGKCKPYGRLQCIIDGAGKLGGVWVFRTTSWMSIRNVVFMLKLFRSRTGGVLAGLPLNLVLTSRRVLVNGRPQTVYVVTLEYIAKSENVLKELMDFGLQVRRKRLETGVDVGALEATVKEEVAVLPDVEIDENGEDVKEEFFPETVLQENDVQENGVTEDSSETTQETTLPSAELENKVSRPTEEQKALIVALLRGRGEPEDKIRATIENLTFEAAAAVIETLQKGGSLATHKEVPTNAKAVEPKPEPGKAGEESKPENTKPANERQIQAIIKLVKKFFGEIDGEVLAAKVKQLSYEQAGEIIRAMSRKEPKFKTFAELEAEINRLVEKTVISEASFNDDDLPF